MGETSTVAEGRISKIKNLASVSHRPPNIVMLTVSQPTVPQPTAAQLAAGSGSGSDDASPPEPLSWPFARRKLQERDVVWNLEGFGAMPPGLIEEENSVSARRDFGCDLIEVKLHSFGIAGRQHEGGAGSAFGADRTEQVGRLGPLIVGDTGA